MANVNAVAKKVAEGAITMIAAIQSLTGFSQSEIERLISQGEAAMDHNRQQQVVRVQREIEAAMRARNW